MRIWSLHPKYLDTKGLVALWRETLLAKHVLTEQTKGYKNHPQLNRFKAASTPVDFIHQYLAEVYNEAISRGYNFNKSKIDWNFEPGSLTVTTGQIEFEKLHLLKKLQIRDPEKYKFLLSEKDWLPHPLFRVVKGEIENWEIV
uniref:pyrimidine dimer DNA glycosylase/endonuclease V n=1 Tax=uncultured Draconibacterium sp. TaxID=1573823 RepID=UPI0032180E43